MRCIVCGNADNNSVIPVKEKLFGFQDSFDYLECPQCGCLQIVTIPKNLAKYYRSDYYSFTKPADYGSLLSRFIRKRQMVYALTGASKIVGSLSCWANLCEAYWLRIDGLLQVRTLSTRLTKKSRILDVGCGNGKLLYRMAAAGFKDLRGVDAFIESDITYSNGVHILKSTIDALNGQYDLITFEHSFEHMPSQLGVLHKIKTLLSTNGLCLINMPVCSSYAWKHYRDNWVNLDCPRHLCIHSTKSMKVLADKAGFNIEKIVFTSRGFQFWGSIQYQKGIALQSDRSYSINPSNSIFTKAQIQQFEKQANKLNKSGVGDCAAFYLTKKQT
ncbi:MAG: class I SAM-dependent methyltransferase [Candidatus Bathyarchaeia archaeon]|jgi:SAM-dependent methyltransferase